MRQSSDDGSKLHIDYSLEVARKSEQAEDCLDTASIRVHSKEDCDIITKFFRDQGWSVKATRFSNVILYEDEHPLEGDPGGKLEP